MTLRENPKLLLDKHKIDRCEHVWLYYIGGVQLIQEVDTYLLYKNPAVQRREVATGHVLSGVSNNSGILQSYGYHK